jgi:hypothetical protein
MDKYLINIYKIGSGIDDKGIDEIFLMLGRDIISQINMFGIGVYVDILLIPDLLQIHLVLCKSACLIRTDHIGSSHSLASTHLSDQVLIIEHFLDTESQGQSHGQRQTFRNSHHNDSNSQNHVFDQIRNVFSRPGRFQSRLINDHTDDQHHEDANSTEQSEFTDVLP